MTPAERPPKTACRLKGKAAIDPRLIPFLDEIAAMLAARWLREHSPDATPKGGHE